MANWKMVAGATRRENDAVPMLDCREVCAETIDVILLLSQVDVSSSEPIRGGTPFAHCG